MDQHPALMVMSAQQRTREVAADVAARGQASTPAAWQGPWRSFAALVRGWRPAAQAPVARPATGLSAAPR